jgi:alanine racemase
MTLALHVDGERWRGHLRGFAEATPGVVPVVKGNGYGFTLGRLARRAQWLREQGLGVDTLAVGTYEELPEVATRYDGDLLVLTPWRSFHAAPDPALGRRLVHTVSRPGDLTGLLEAQPGARYVLELETSMRRHGMSAQELWALAEELPGGRLEGVALHLPLASGQHLAEVERLLTDLVAADLPTSTVWVSHLTAPELDRLRTAYADLTVRPRIGTDLWLGDREALRVTATVLDVHPLARGDVFGYRGRSAPREGHLLVVSGGTAHGIGLEAPKGEAGLKARASIVARGGLDAMGLTRSPFWVDGKQRLFAEPPHMQASMLFLPSDATVPEVGDLVDVRVRYTATAFDRIEVV